MGFTIAVANNYNIKSPAADYKLSTTQSLTADSKRSEKTSLMSDYNSTKSPAADYNRSAKQSSMSNYNSSETNAIENDYT